MTTLGATLSTTTFPTGGGSGDAVDIAVADAGGYFPTDNVEAALAAISGSTWYPTAQTSAGIQAAIDAAHAVGGGVVQLAGAYTCATTIKTYPKVTLMGVQAGWTPGATTLTATAGLTGNVIESANITDLSGDYLHFTNILNIEVVGNTIAGGGIVLEQMGELSTIHNVMVTDCYSHGIEIRGFSTPVHIGFVAVHGNGRDGIGAGLYLNTQNLTHNSVVYVTGDNNGGALVLIENLYKGSVHIANFKSERWLTGGVVGNPNVIDIQGGDGGLVIIGAGRVAVTSGNGAPGANAIIRNQGTGIGNLARIVCYGGVAYDTTAAAYAYDYEEISSSGTFTMPINTNVQHPFAYRSLGTLHTLVDGSAALSIARINASAGTTYSVMHKRPANAVAHFQIPEWGGVEWGPGSGAVDTNLYRAAANELGTDDTFYAALGLRLPEQTAPSAPAANNAKIYAVDDGGGNTTIAALFSSGSAQVIASQAGALFATVAQGVTADAAQPIAQSVNAQTGTTYTLVAADKGKLVSLSNGSAITLTVPQDSDATIAIGTYVDLYQLGAGQVTVAAGSGATLRVSGLTAKARAQYSRFGVQKVSANTWSLFGDLAAS